MSVKVKEIIDSSSIEIPHLKDIFSQNLILNNFGEPHLKELF